ncbi:MAG: ribokinase, partial [Xenophilus sp.]
MLLVFGSINLDISLRAPHLPAPGETVLGDGCLVSPGGKGANQAHAARRYGMPTTLVGAVGSDPFAAPALARLQAAGVDLAPLQRLPGATGCAGIVVDAAGENQIVVAPGANLRLRASAVPDALLARAGAVLLQMEIDPAQNEALLRRVAGRSGCLKLLNNAPAQPLPGELLGWLDLLIVNEGELRQTARGAGLDDSGGPLELLQALASRFNLTAVLTLGAAGVAACTAAGTRLRLPALPVAATDTTGAGDTFAGVLAAALLEARPLHDALARASVAAGLACSRAGAQLAQPGRDEIEAA